MLFSPSAHLVTRSARICHFAHRLFHSRVASPSPSICICCASSRLLLQPRFPGVLHHPDLVSFLLGFSFVTPFINVLAAALALFGLATFTASAHPGSGIIADAQGRVYFSEAGDIDAHLPGAIWQIDQQGKLTRLHEGGAHFLTLDLKRGFAQANLDRYHGA